MIPAFFDLFPPTALNKIAPWNASVSDNSQTLSRALKWLQAAGIGREGGSHTHLADMDA